MKFLISFLVLFASCLSASAEATTYKIDARPDRMRLYNFSDHSVYFEFYLHLPFFLYTGNDDDYATGKLNWGVTVPPGKFADVEPSHLERAKHTSLWLKGGHSEVNTIIWESEAKARHFSLVKFKEWAQGELSGGVDDLLGNVWQLISGNHDEEVIDGMVGYVVNLSVDHSFVAYWDKKHRAEKGTLDTALVHPSRRHFTLYEHDSFRGTPFAVAYDDLDDFDDDFEKFNNVTSSAIVHRHSWKFFRSADYKGDSTVLHSNHRYPNAAAMGIKDNTISSFRKHY